MPYKDKILTGKALEDQVDEWVSYGTIEPSAGAAIKDVSQKGEWRDLSDRYFVLLGAGSAMGPLKLLLELGANIVAIDLDRPGIWQRLLDLAENSCGTITFPLKEGKPQASLTTRQELCAAAGANLLAHTPEILNWCDGGEREKCLTADGGPRVPFASTKPGSLPACFAALASIQGVVGLVGEVSN